MFKILSFLTRKDGLGAAEFADYYESRHIPFILGLAPAPPVYTRRYVTRGAELDAENGSVDFDVVTEVGFPDREAFLAWMAAVSKPGVGERVAEDEARFLDRSRTRSYVVDERVSNGS